MTAQDGSAAVSSLFGSVQVIVEEGTWVDEGGLVIFGSVECDRACVPAPGATRVSLRAVGAFGSVEIVTREEYETDGDDRGLDRSAR